MQCQCANEDYCNELAQCHLFNPIWATHHEMDPGCQALCCLEQVLGCKCSIQLSSISMDSSFFVWPKPLLLVVAVISLSPLVFLPLDSPIIFILLLLLSKFLHDCNIILFILFLSNFQRGLGILISNGWIGALFQQ